MPFLHEADIPTYETPERAVRAFMYMVEYTRNLELLSQVPPKLATELYFNRDQVFRTIYECFEQEIELLGELQSKEILEAYGIPVNPTVLATSVEEAVSKAFELEGPLVMKLVSPDIPHKSDADGIALDLRNEEDIRAAYAKIINAAKAFNPEATITREQLAVMLYRYAGSPQADTSLSAFADAASVSDWAQDGMNWAVAQGVLTGKTGSVLDPQGTASRAEVATMLMRFVQNQGN